MNIKELRIGNTVRLSDTWHINHNMERNMTIEYFGYDSIHKKHLVNGYTINCIIPIPLTEEMLDKYELGGIINNVPEYLHQLQNLYFDLTNEELAVKQIKFSI